MPLTSDSQERHLVYNKQLIITVRLILIYHSVQDTLRQTGSTTLQNADGRPVVDNADTEIARDSPTDKCKRDCHTVEPRKSMLNRRIILTMADNANQFKITAIIVLKLISSPQCDANFSIAYDTAVTTRG